MVLRCGKRSEWKLEEVGGKRVIKTACYYKGGSHCNRGGAPAWGGDGKG